jgi:hypothetical protein
LTVQLNESVLNLAPRSEHSPDALGTLFSPDLIEVTQIEEDIIAARSFAPGMQPADDLYPSATMPGKDIENLLLGPGRIVVSGME